MGAPIIEVKGISKKYRIGHRENYLSLRDSLVNIIKKPLNFLKGSSDIDASNDEFWALKDVSFNVEQGEVIGIIGRNGAGKTTMLKILSRITYPTKGEIHVRGRVASLLEVGTGFHPELTGRENIYFNGSILGMKKREIDKKFDEIVAFSEIEKFIDTPAKRYSSGMYLRLAFAVAAHLEPEILVIDEVLAVGDAAFQKRCLGKMEEVSKEGRTVFFVSHNMAAIRHLCPKAILLTSGIIAAEGASASVIDSYLSGTRATEVGNIDRLISELVADPSFRLTQIHLAQNGCKIKNFVENGKPLEIIIEYQVMQTTAGLRVFFDLLDDQETLLLRSFHDEDNDNIPTMQPGRYRTTAVIPSNFLGPIDYIIAVKAGIHNQRYCLPIPGIRIPIKVELTGGYNRAYASDHFQGKLAMNLQWKTAKYG